MSQVTNYRKLWWILPIVILLLAFYNVLRSFKITLLWSADVRRHHVSATFDIPGLGNLLFQYASLVGIAEHSAKIPVIPTKCRLNNVFDLPIDKSNDSRPGLQWGKVVEQKPSAYDDKIDNLQFDHDIEVIGFLQSWMYFANFQEELRKHLTFKPSIQESANKFMQKCSSEIKKKQIDRPVYICLHVRRGDYLKENFQKLGYTVADVNYTNRAMDYYEKKLAGQNLTYVIVSDDIEWCRQNVRSSRLTFYSSNEDTVDLAILARCNHTIMTTGTFGWWGAWLAGGTVVFYKDFPKNDSKLNRAFSANRADYYMPSWIGL